MQQFCSTAVGETCARRCRLFLPDFGQEVADRAGQAQSAGVSVDPRLLSHVMASTGLSAEAAERLVEDVLAFHDESVAQYVRRRHAELKTYGARNPEIFARLREELRGRVVAAPDLTERQIRRLIYG